MKNLTGFLKKILFIFSFLALFSFFTNKIYSNDLIVYSDFYHTWDGNTLNSTIYLTLTSDTSYVLTSYIISIPERDIAPNILLINRNSSLEPTIHTTDTMTNLSLDMQNVPISSEKPVTLKITYSTVTEGNSLSLLSSVLDTQVRTFSFTYPSSLGLISWSSTPINSVNTKGDKTEIITGTPQAERINMSIGSNITYRFKISKNLLNSSEEILLSDIKLPLNNSYQHIVIESYSPEPDRAYRDADNNYILQYSLAPLSSMDIEIEGYILMNKTQYTKPLIIDIPTSNLWKINNISLAKQINKYLENSGLKLPETFSSISQLQSNDEKEILYTSIYKYVINVLKPNTDTIGSLLGSERLGGEEVLLKQDICTSEDYSDALIALLRYYDIPSRLVLGYITNISNYHPEGIYHHWVEYYDEVQKDWLILDPFLEDYSNISLLKREMQDHIAIIYRYTNPNLPKLPFFSPEELKIELIDEEIELKHSVESYFSLEPYTISNPYLSGSIITKNTGNTILDNFLIVESNPNLSDYIDYIENNTETILLPGQTHNIKFNIPASAILDDMFASLNIESGTYAIEKEYVEYNLETLKDYKALNILSKAISILFFIFLNIAVYYVIKNNKQRK